MKKKIELMKRFVDAQDEVALAVNADLTNRGIACFNILGSPGAGKTSFILAIHAALSAHVDQFKLTVIEADLESSIDADLLTSRGIESWQINTHGACHLDAPVMKDFYAGHAIPDGSCLFIENIGNLICPVEFFLGEHFRILVCSTAEGSDKPYKYPYAFSKSDCIVVTKSDLVPHVGFDESFFMKGVRECNRDATVVKTSAKTGAGIAEAAAWIAESMKKVRPA